MDFGAMARRALRAAKLDVTLFNEVEADSSLNSQALMVVILAAVLSFIGSVLSGAFSSVLGSAMGVSMGFGALLVAAVVSAIWIVIGYYVWSYLTWFIGTRFFGGTADVGELKRAIGFSYAPQWLGVLSFIPCAGAIVGLVVMIWSLVCGIIAIREALDVDTGKAVITALIGWLVIFVISMVIGVVFGVGMAAVGGLPS
ncbi:MAG TPA: Yip1 family protein [Anaerolineae bacterium]|nr:Yip1 family protein [Anaerolineae bacterium]HNU03626.1 Yip1 family protein [Anaerolineae bacterium]